jgi:hypothetical protein
MPDARRRIPLPPKTFFVFVFVFVIVFVFIVIVIVTVIVPIPMLDAGSTIGLISGGAPPLDAPFPRRAPLGCPPLTLSGPDGPPRLSDGDPNIVKNGIPHDALSSACHSL